MPVTSTADAKSRTTRDVHTAGGATLRRTGLWARGVDIQTLGILFVLSGIVDLLWILSYSDYALKVFGTTFGGWVGEALKLQHPVIHLAIGLGFLLTRRWAFWVYLGYLGLACASEIVTQVVLGYHPVRTTMILISLAFAAYVVARRAVFR